MGSWHPGLGNQLGVDIGLLQVVLVLVSGQH